ncbi:Ubiquitin carboxyl-terminal hydrolase 19 [Durusdinium trenchii]|uniref:Ubiquitin carboxyl-terminal hydrolase 19 n=1 Tax=Durusdinium trenchii TaxID=1381693 RepID=A0ABP0IBW3_9DINO
MRQYVQIEMILPHGPGTPSAEIADRLGDGTALKAARRRPSRDGGRAPKTGPEQTAVVRGAGLRQSVAVVAEVALELVVDWNLGHKGDCGLGDILQVKSPVPKPPARLLAESVERPVHSDASWRKLLESSDFSARGGWPRGLRNAWSPSKPACLGMLAHQTMEPS